MGDGSNDAAVKRFAAAFGDEIAQAYAARMGRLSPATIHASTVSVRYYDHTGMGHVFIRVHGLVLVDPDPVFNPTADIRLNASLLSGFVGDGLTNLERRLSSVLEGYGEAEVTCSECDGNRVSRNNESWCGTCGGEGTVPKNEV